MNMKSSMFNAVNCVPLWCMTSAHQMTEIKMVYSCFGIFFFLWTTCPQIISLYINKLHSASKCRLISCMFAKLHCCILLFIALVIKAVCHLATEWTRRCVGIFVQSGSKYRPEVAHQRERSEILEEGGRIVGNGKSERRKCTGGKGKKSGMEKKE